MKKRTLLLSLLLMLVLTACGAATPAPQEATPTLPPQPPQLSTTPLAPTPQGGAGATPQGGAVATTAPSPTTPSGKVLVIADLDLPGVLEAANAIQHSLPHPAGAPQVQVLSVPSLAPELITPDVKLVVALTPLDNLAQLAAARPQVTFAGVFTAAILPAAPNLSLILTPPENQAYLAGYITTLISPDWRSAGLLLLPANAGPITQAFINGASYYCGRCTPLRGPIVVFPQVAATTAAGAVDAFARLQPSLPETLYIDYPVSTPELLQVAARLKLVVLGSLPFTRLPDDSVKTRWAVTLRPDLLNALESLWPSLVAGKGGDSVTAGFTFSDINPQYFTPGKQRLAQQVIAGLLDGTLAPLTPGP